MGDEANVRRVTEEPRWCGRLVAALGGLALGATACGPNGGADADATSIERAVKGGAPTSAGRRAYREWVRTELPFGDATYQMTDPEKFRDLRCSTYPIFKVDAVGAIVHIAHGSASVICSAVAVKVDRIVTARHCLWSGGASGEYYFTTAADAYGAGSTELHRLKNPRGYTPDPTIDIGTIDLETSLPAMPLPELATDLSPDALRRVLEPGRPLLKVGYGVWTHFSDKGELESTIGDRSCATVSVSTVSATSFSYSPKWPPAGQICSADSGGPALVWPTADAPRALLIGITSTSPAQTQFCGTGGTDAMVPGLDRRWLMD